MTAIKIQAFAGMIPIQDAQLLPDSAAQKSVDAWLYSGAIEGIRDPKLVHTLSGSAFKRAFRVPSFARVDKDHLVDSYWLEFQNQDVSCIKAPLDNDQYERFYWAGDTDVNGNSWPHYNTKDRIIAGLPAYRLGIPTPSVAPVVATSPAGAFTLGAGVFRISSPGANLVYSKKSTGSACDTGSFSITAQKATLTYRNFANVETPDFETQSNIVDPSYTLTPSGTVTELLTARAYVYTWVSTYGEEGPPSPATVLIGKQGDHWKVGLTAPAAGDTANRSIAKARIYRTVSTQTGSADYYLVAEVPIDQLTYTDDADDTTVAASANLESTFYTPPPDDLTGFVNMPNGMVVGWRANELWFCEPYLPHAWPPTYTLTTDYNIVGLGVVGQSVVALTQSAVFAVTGVNPSVMTMATLAGGEPCLSRGSIVSSKTGVYYAGSSGLMKATAYGVEALTRVVADKSYWNSALHLDTVHAAKLGESYFASGVVSSGSYQVGAFEADAFEQLDYTGSTNGVIIDVTDPRMAWAEWTSDGNIQSLYNDPWSGEVLFVKNGGVYTLDVAAGHRRTYTWRSKQFHVENQKNLGAMKLYFTVPSDAVNPGTVTLYADGRQVWSRPLGASGEIMKLTSGYKAEVYEVEITSDYIVREVHLASTTKELGKI